MKRILCGVIASFGLFNPISAQTLETTDQIFPVRFGKVAPLARYVRLVSGEKQIAPVTPVALTREEIDRLRIVFLRDSLESKDGPQFLTMTTTSTNRNDHVIDENVQYAVTFHRLEDAAAELRQLERYVSQVNPMGYFNPELMEEIPIQVDSLDAWGHLFIRIELEQEIVKYYGRIKNKLEYHILVKGKRIQTGFALTVPKVLYDTCDDDTVRYGNTSAMLRFFLLDGESGVAYPISVGLGTFGVDSPIDVSRSGGGFAISAYFDIIQLLRRVNVKMSYNVNAGVDVSPFFPIGHKPRILFSARVGISP